MVDTIKLVLDKTMFRITDVSLFQKQRQNASRGYFTLVQNPTKSELQNGIYKPRLTFTKRFNCSGHFEETLAVELSLPKLHHKNNFDELQDSDFDTLTDLLFSGLSRMGVQTSKAILVSAPVALIHYSKNIPFTDGTTSHYLISKIKEANISLALDINQTDYRNNGQSYKWHTNSYEVAFYDKIKDHEMSKKSEKRAMEKDNTIQLGIFDTFQNTKLEVLRMEVRLNNRQKMKRLFKTLGIETELTFQNLFSSKISQKVLLYYLVELEKQRPKLLDYSSSNTKALLADLIVNNPNLGIRHIIQLFGLKTILDTIVPRELRAMCGNYSSRSWYRLIKDANSIKLPNTINPLKVISKHLIEFKPLKLVDFQVEMINNDKYNKEIH